MYRVFLKQNEYTGWDGEGEIYVRDFPTRSLALAFVRSSGYVQDLAGWMRGGAKWQTCYRIEKA